MFFSLAGQEEIIIKLKISTRKLISSCLSKISLNQDDSTTNKCGIKNLSQHVDKFPFVVLRNKMDIQTQKSRKAFNYLLLMILKKDRRAAAEIGLVSYLFC